MEHLFNQNLEFQKDIFRNIVSLRESQDLFDDINDDDKTISAIASRVEAEAKKDIPLGFIERGFHYTTAIAYPFETDPFMETRYSDGKFGVWYGSLEFQTSIFETAHHMMKDESDVIGIQEMIVRERAVYNVYCNAILIDLRGKEKEYPALIFDNYEFTQQIGKKIHQQGHPGLLAPSARCLGNNAVIFNVDRLSNPRVHCYLTYTFDPQKNELIVERERGKILMTVNAEQLSR